MNVLITGANGFIASSLAKYLFDNNVKVYGTSSKEINNSSCVKTFKVKLGEVLDIEYIPFDWVVHCVYDKNLSIEKNTQSTISWAQELKNRGVEKQIFISSISAISGNMSQYSLIKHEIETWFLENDMYVIRPGLVVGNGGLFQQMIKKVMTFPVMPLVNGGNQDIKLIGINDLISEIMKVLNNVQVNKELNLFYTNKFILKNVLKEIAKFYDKKIIFITIPFLIIFNIARLFEVLKINIGITSQNIRGLVSNDIDVKSSTKFKKDISNIIVENLKEYT